MADFLESTVVVDISLAHNILIIGAGVSGLSVALTHLRRGFDVTLLERGEVGGESSWAGGGILSTLPPWDYAESLSKLALCSMFTYADWIEGIEALVKGSAEYWRCGMHVLGISQAERALSWCDAHDITAQLRFAHNGQSLWLPQIAQIRNPLLITILREAVVKLGGVIYSKSAVETTVTQSTRMMAVHTPNGKFTANQFVLATGAWAGLTSPLMVGVPNIRPIRGQMLLFKLEPGVLDTIVYRNGLYVIPRRDGHILVGSTLENVGFDKSTDVPTGERLHREAAELLPILNSVQPIQHWAGLRPGSPDNIPVIGRHPDFDNVFVNTGHYRYGVTMAPASAELLVDLMEGKTPALDPAPYSWEAALQRKWTENL